MPRRPAALPIIFPMVLRWFYRGSPMILRTCPLNLFGSFSTVKRICSRAGSTGFRAETDSESIQVCSFYRNCEFSIKHVSPFRLFFKIILANSFLTSIMRNAVLDGVFPLLRISVKFLDLTCFLFPERIRYQSLWGHSVSGVQIRDSMSAAPAIRKKKKFRGGGIRSCRRNIKKKV